MASWIAAFQSVAFKENTSNNIIEEEFNDLYCSSGEGVFSIQLEETEASQRCGLSPKMYTLVVAAVDVKLMDKDVVMFTWPYRYIRRYGHRDGKFTFEAGRKCESGEGSFVFKHKNQQEIFRCISARMKSMKKMLSGENSPSIECNDAQFHAALSMEAGSRSPLPPSPNSSTNLIDLDFPLQNSQKPDPPVNFLVKTPSPVTKPKPAKPPRKYGFTSILDKSDPTTCGKYRKLNSPTSLDIEPDTEKHSYDLVEVRNDAWKTHGLDCVPHMERTKQIRLLDEDGDDESQYEKMSLPLSLNNSIQSKISSTSEVLTPASSIIHNNSCRTDPLNYDKLQHFGSMHKITPRPGFKTPNSSQSSSQATTPVSPSDPNKSWNSYDVVEDLNKVSLEDSHHPYSVVRKKCNNSVSSPTNPKYKVINDSEYAIVSKAKRV